MRVLAASAVAAFALGVAAQNTSCVDGLFMVVSRGTGIAPGLGTEAELAKHIKERIDNSEVVALDYPATLADPDYGDSMTEGAVNLKKVVTDYNGKCPDGKIALVGYSQGAHLTTEAVCGGHSGFNNLSAFPSKLIENNVVAIVLFGDPSHVANTTYDRGTSIEDGIFKQTNTTLCTKYDDRLVSYCNTGDVYCDSGDNKTVHGLYEYYFGDEVLEYIVDKYEKADAAETSAAPTNSGSGGDGPSNTASGSGPTDAPDAGAMLAPGGALLVLAPLAAMAVIFDVI